MQNNDIQFYCDNRSIIVSNFLTEQECNKLDNFMRTFNYDGLQEYPSEYFNKRQISKKQMSTQPGFENIMDPIEKDLENIINRIYKVLNNNDRLEDWVSGNPVLMKMFKDCIPESKRDSILQSGDKYFKEGFFIHRDNHGWMPNPVIWGAVVYFNDDYEGGELFYPEYNFSYKPKRKDLVLHDGEILHGVSEVTSGERYNLTVVIKIKDNEQQIPLPIKEKSYQGGDYYYPPGYWGKRMPDDSIQGDIRNPRDDGTVSEYNANPTLWVPKV
jgi:hypothetical protein